MRSLSDDIGSEQSKLVVVNTRQIMLREQVDDVDVFKSRAHAEREERSARVMNNRTIEMKKGRRRNSRSNIT